MLSAGTGMSAPQLSQLKWSISPGSCLNNEDIYNEGTQIYLIHHSLRFLRKMKQLAYLELV